MKRSNIFNANLTYFIIIALFAVVRICSSLNLFLFLGEGKSVILTCVIQLGLLFLLPLTMISKLNKKRVGETLEETGFKGISLKTFLISICIGVIVFILTIALSSFWSYFLSFFGYAPTSGGTTVEATWEGFALSMLTIAILPAFCEEFTHRGMLLNNYKSLGLKRAVIYSSLLFGLLHLNIDQFFYASMIGAVLALVTLFSRSILPAMIIHFMNNGISVYLSFAKAKDLPLGNLLENVNSYLSTGNFFTNLIVIILFLTLLAVILYYLIIALLNDNAKKSIKKYAEQAAINEMRRSVLGDDANIEPVTETVVVFDKAQQGQPLKVRIPYEVLGFHIAPQVKPSALDNVFFYSSVLLGTLITLSTLIWGII